MSDIAIIGTVGIPARYGGFETLAEKLVEYLSENNKLTVFCSRKAYSKQFRKTYVPAKNTSIIYLPFSANGFQSIIYDICCILIACFSKKKHLLILGVSGCIILPLLKPFTKSKFHIHVDGIEWKRKKWGFFARNYLRLAEVIAVRNAETIISDNKGIEEYISSRYNKPSVFIPYGGDHTNPKENDLLKKNNYLPNSYYLKVGRIVPENNIHVILEAFVNSSKSLVLVGNWQNSSYGRKLFNRFKSEKNLVLLNPIYNQQKLDLLRLNCQVYIHGHSAGGTNPTLVEAMYLGLPIIAFDCKFNRYSTFNRGIYFKNSQNLKEIIDNFNFVEMKRIAIDLKVKAEEIYVWKEVTNSYSNLFKDKKVIRIGELKEFKRAI